MEETIAEEEAEMAAAESEEEEEEEKQEEGVVTVGDEVVPRTCGAYAWDFRKDVFLSSAKPMRTRTHPFIRRYGLFAGASPPCPQKVPSLSLPVREHTR